LTLVGTLAEILFEILHTYGVMGQIEKAKVFKIAPNDKIFTNR